MKKFNHAYALGFSVNTDRDAEQPVDPREIIPAILARLSNIVECDELDEALGQPYDTYENQT